MVMMGLLVGLLILSLSTFLSSFLVQKTKNITETYSRLLEYHELFISTLLCNLSYFEWEINIYRKILYLFWCDYKFDGALLWEFLSVSGYFHSIF